MNARAQFLEKRNSGIGGSDIGAILGLSRFKSAVDVWLEKTGRKESPSESTLQQRFGIIGEEFVAKEYTKKTGSKVVRFNSQLVHPEHSFIIGNVDRLVVPEGKSVAHHMGQIRTDRGMEAKCVSAFAGGEWGDDTSDDVPAFYYAQCAWYQALTGCQYWDLAALIGNHRFEVYSFDRDPQLEKMVISKAIEFWNKHVLTDVPPEPQSVDDIAALYPKSEEGKKAIANAEIAATVEKIKNNKAILKSLENQLETEMLCVKQFMLDCDLLIDSEGNALLSWKNNKDSKKTDYEKAFNDLLEMFSQYKMLCDPAQIKNEIIDRHTKTTAGARVFRLLK